MRRRYERENGARRRESSALAFPEVAFRVTVDGKERLAWPAAASVRERAGALWGAHHAEQRLEVLGEREGMRVHALLGLPEHARATREGQTFLVNRRWIQSPLIAQALRQAYGNLLPAGRYPAAAVWLTIPAERLDVNVHPTKREVRFASEDAVFSLVASACAQVLAPIHPPFTVVQGGSAEPSWAERVSESPPDQTYLGFEAAPTAPAQPTPAGRAREAEGAGAAEGPTLWQLHATYILAPVRDGLVIVDQHAAHERILYEEARARLEGQRGSSQQLLFPALVELSRDQFDLLLELGPSLQQLGWDLAPLGPPAVIIRGLPAGFRADRPGALLQDILDGVAEHSGRTVDDDFTEKLARSYACHAAVRAGETLTQEEMRTLLDRLFDDDAAAPGCNRLGREEHTPQDEAEHAGHSRTPDHPEAAAQVGEGVPELEQIASHSNRHSGLCALRHRDRENHIDQLCSFHADFHRRVLVFCHGCTLLKGLVHAIHGVGHQIVNPSAQANDAEPPGGIGQHLRTAGRYQNTLDGRARIGIEHAPFNIAGQRGYGFIRPAANGVHDLSRSIDEQHAIANGGISVGIFVDAERSTTHVTIFDDGFIWDGKFGSVGVRVHNGHLIIHWVQSQPGDFIGQGQTYTTTDPAAFTLTGITL